MVHCHYHNNWPDIVNTPYRSSHTNNIFHIVKHLGRLIVLVNVIHNHYDHIVLIQIPGHSYHFNNKIHLLYIFHPSHASLQSEIHPTIVRNGAWHLPSSINQHFHCCHALWCYHQRHFNNQHTSTIHAKQSVHTNNTRKSGRDSNTSYLT